MAAIARLRIRLLGELQLLGRGGRPMALPASKKTRALVGYLVATGHSHRRERLCDLLWDGPDDPRAELRWSLNKIRPLLNEPGITRLTADRERVGFEAGNADVDLVRVRHLLAAGVSALSADELKAAVDLFRGEFLDGLDLPACYRYQEWCLAEREAVSRLRLAALDALVRRLDDMPDEALVYARALVAVDRLSEIAHATVVRFLGRLGRRKEALEYCDYARRLLERELGAALSGQIERERRALGSPVARLSAPEPVSRSPVEPAVPARSGDQSFPFVGRNAECALLESLASAAAAGEGRQVLLIRGEAGIGKSRLLARLQERMHAVGGRAVGGRAFEAEMGRPYAIWIDLLRALVHERGPEGLSNLAPLLPEIARRRASPADKSQLFDAVVNVLKIVIAEQPTALTLDDLQWIDEASASLLHYVIRTFDGPSPLLLACAARSGELEDNRGLGHGAACAPARGAVGRDCARSRRPRKKPPSSSMPSIRASIPIAYLPTAKAIRCSSWNWHARGHGISREDARWRCRSEPQHRSRHRWTTGQAEGPQPRAADLGGSARTKLLARSPGPYRRVRHLRIASGARRIGAAWHREAGWVGYIRLRA